MTELFSEEDDRPKRVIEYHSPTTIDESSSWVGKLVVIGMFAIPAVLFAIVIVYSWYLKLR